MLNLLYKDFVLLKKTILFAAGYGIFLFIAFNKPIFSDLIYNMGTNAIAYIILMTAISNDEKNKTEIILNSLPVKRKKLMGYKYILAFVAVFFGLGLMGVFGAILKSSGLVSVSRYVSINDLLFSLSSVLLLSSLYFPLLLKIGSKYARIINLFFFLSVFLLPSWIKSLLMDDNVNKWGVVEVIINYFTNIPLWLVGTVLLAITLVLNSISYFIAVQIYQNKEF